MSAFLALMLSWGGTYPAALSWGHWRAIPGPSPRGSKRATPPKVTSSRPPNHPPMRAAIYIRVSTQEQSEHGVSIAMQERDCRERCQRLGAEVAAVYRDEGLSGTDLRRPQLKALLADLPQYDAVVIWRLDRLTRSLAHLADLISTFQAAGVGLVSVRENIDAGSAIGRLVLHIMGSVAEFAVGLLRENVTAALTHIARTGRSPGGVVYGYRREDKRLVVDADAAEIVREVFRRFSAGEPQRQIARDLTDRGVLQLRDGAQWTSTMVRNILTNPVYIGEFRWGGEVWQGDHEAIISRRTWNKAQSLLSQRVTTLGRPATSIASVLRCGVCGSCISVSTFARGAYRHRAYKCWARAQRTEQHAPVYHPEAALLAVIWRHTELLLSGADPGEAIKSARVEQARRDLQAGDLRRQLADVDAQLDRLADLYLSEALDLATIERRAQPLRAEKARLESSAVDAGPVNVGLWRAIERLGVEGLLVNIREGPLEGQAEFLRSVYSRVELLPGKRVVFHAQGLPPVERVLPRYYSEARGVTDIGF